MEKMIVEIQCPATSKSYEFRLSKKLSTTDGKEKIIDEIRTLEKNDKLFADNVSIFSARTECILNEKMTFSENGVKSGDILMII